MATSILNLNPEQQKKLTLLLGGIPSEGKEWRIDTLANAIRNSIKKLGYSRVPISYSRVFAGNYLQVQFRGEEYVTLNGLTFKLVQSFGGDARTCQRGGDIIYLPGDDDPLGL